LSRGGKECKIEAADRWVKWSMKVDEGVWKTCGEGRNVGGGTRYSLGQSFGWPKHADIGAVRDSGEGELGGRIDKD